MKPGETFQTSIWLDGTETPELLDRYKSDAAASLMAEGMVMTPLRWATLLPGEDNVPEVPDHIQGPAVCLLVGEADVVAVAVDSGFFLTELEPRDLARLRRVTREAYGRQFPQYGNLTDRQCDTLINDLGPDAAVASLESGKMYIQ